MNDHIAGLRAIAPLVPRIAINGLFSIRAKVAIGYHRSVVIKSWRSSSRRNRLAYMVYSLVDLSLRDLELLLMLKIDSRSFPINSDSSFNIDQFHNLLGRSIV